MPKVHVLDKELAELIAAGEVIERPCSVVKELTENAIDSGATSVTVEIKQGGISYIRITDNGCGISYEDVPTAFLRHATSKLNVKDDLDRITTLGFRGEALASICAVAKCEVITKPKGDEYGTRYAIEGTQEMLWEKTGCPDGTTMIVRDIFYNVPARLKFLKKDRYEGNAIANIVSKIALSHPEISFRFIRNNTQEMFTPGDSRLYSAIYSVMGKEFAASLIPVSYKLGGIGVSGYTVKPLWGRKNRTMQHFFINGRYVRSLTCMTALEEAYRNSIMEGKLPACVLFMDIPPSVVDVNVHPAKTEVRFSDDRMIYDAVYFAVKNALLSDSRPAQIEIPQHKPTAADYAMPMFTAPANPVQTAIEDTSVSGRIGSVTPAVSNGETENRPAAVVTNPANAVNKPFSGNAPVNAQAVVPNRIAAESAVKRPDRKPDNAPENYPVNATVNSSANVTDKAPVTAKETRPADLSQHLQTSYAASAEDGAIDNLKAGNDKREFKYIGSSAFNEPSSKIDNTAVAGGEREIFFRIIGEAFRNYIIVESEDGILIVDKHAAHERIRFERLRTGREDLSAQMLLSPEELLLDYGEYDALVKNLRVCVDCGFEITPMDAPKVLIKGIPSMLDKSDASDIVAELAQNLANHRHDPLPEILDDIYHTMACRGAIKANDITDPEELKSLVKQILSDSRIRYCPHGRPVMFRLTKRELEKQFKRIV